MWLIMNGGRTVRHWSSGTVSRTPGYKCTQMGAVTENRTESLLWTRTRVSCNLNNVMLSAALFSLFLILHSLSHISIISSNTSPGFFSFISSSSPIPSFFLPSFRLLFGSLFPLYFFFCLSMFSFL